MYPQARGPRIRCTPGSGVHGSGASLVHPKCPFSFEHWKSFFFVLDKIAARNLKAFKYIGGGDPQEKQSAVGFRESYSFQIVRNIIYNACALLIESSIASCSFVFSIACVDGVLTVSVLDHNKVQTCIWSDTASSVWRYAATRLNTQIINYLWVHSLQSNETSFHIMHVRQGVRHIWKPTRFSVWETLFRICGSVFDLWETDRGDLRTCGRQFKGV